MFLEKPLVPRGKDGILRVIAPGRISTEHQDILAIASKQNECETWLKQHYAGPYEITRLSEQASGWLAGRETIAEAENLIRSGQVDLVLLTEVRDVFRNPKFIWGFVHRCLDNDTRVISIYDRVDTSIEGWESNMNQAVGHHSMTVPQTRRRVNSKASLTFPQGGMTMKVRFGYRKLTKAEADSGKFGPPGLRQARVDGCTLTIRDARDRLMRGDAWTSVVAWLIESGVSPGKYVRNGRWTVKVLMSLMRDPILYGLRRFRTTRSRFIYQTGRHRVFANPDGPMVQLCPTLAHMTKEEFDDLQAVLDAKKQQAPFPEGHKKGRANPMWNRRRSQSTWPGQHPTCTACGGRLYKIGAYLRCCNSLDMNNRTCWNCVQVNLQTVIQKILPWVITVVSQFPIFRQHLVDACWAEYKAARRREHSKSPDRKRALGPLEREAKKLAQAIARGEIELVEDHLKDLQRCVGRTKKRAKKAHERGGDKPEFLTREAVLADLEGASTLLVQSSFSFAELLRRLLWRFEIFPVQTLDCLQIRARAKVTLSFEAWAKPGEEVPEPISTSIDLFEPPAAITHLAAVVAARSQSPKAGYRRIAAQLGMGLMTVKRAVHYARRMDEAGWTEPFQELTEAPLKAARWRNPEPRKGDLPAA